MILGKSTHAISGLPALTPLLVVVVVAVVARGTSALYQGDMVTPLPGTYDQISYDALSRQVLAGHGFSFGVGWWPATRAGEPTAHWSFLYTLYLAAVYGLFGPHPLIARLIQAVVAGILHPWLSWRIGHRLFGPKAGLAAALIAALYPYFVYYAGALMTETFYILAILLSLDIAMGMAQHRATLLKRRGPGIRRTLRSARPWLLLGLALGITALFRQVVLIFVPVLFAWLLWAVTRRVPEALPPLQHRIRDRMRSCRWALAGLCITSAVLLLLILPWTARNYLAFGRFVLLNTNAGYAFFWANHPVHGTNFMPILVGADYDDLIPPELRQLDEAALDQALLRDGIRFVVEDPGRYALLSLSRVRDYFQFWPSGESGLASNIARFLSFGILLPFALYGLFISVRQREGREAIVLLWLFVAVYSLVHILSWALVRYRLPVDAVLAPFAALAVQAVLERGRVKAPKTSLVANTGLSGGSTAHVDYPDLRKPRSKARR